MQALLTIFASSFVLAVWGIILLLLMLRALEIAAFAVLASMAVFVAMGIVVGVVALW